MKFQPLYNFFTGTLRGRLIIGVAIVHAVMMSLFISDLTLRQRAMLLDRQTEQATALSQALATSAAGWIAANDIAGLEELVDAQRRYPELIFAVLTDERGRVLADTDKKRRGLFLLDLPGNTSQTVLARTPTLVDVAVPAMVGGHNVGWARVGVGQKTAVKTLTRITTSGVLYALAAIVAGSLIAWLMGRQITRRLYAIQETITRVSSGNTLARTTLTGTDEAAVLAGEFNKMLDEIAARDTLLLDTNRLLQSELAERKHAEESLQRERTLLRCIIDSADDLIFIKDRNCAYLACNKASEALIGLAESAQVGKTDFDFFTKEQAEAIHRDDLKVLNDRKPLKTEEWVDYPDGHKVLLETRKIPFYDTDGEIMGLVGICRDITERKRAEQSVLEAQQVFRVLVENSPDIIARYDRDCRRTYVNPAYLKIAQLAEEDLLTKAPVQVSPLPPAGAAMLQNLLLRVLDSGIADNIDVVWPKADGIDYWYNIFAFPEYDRDGRIISVMTVSRDITQRKTTELELQQLNEELEERVWERTAELEQKNIELERINKVFVGRELRMVELKERIAELEMKYGTRKQQHADQG